MAFRNISSVQLPNPVSLSGVRFMAKLTPHGPTHAVRWLLAAVPQPVGPINVAGTFATLSPAGVPDNCRVISNSGAPLANVFGVSQSWHPPTVTRYLPLSTGDCAAFALSTMW